MKTLIKLLLFLFFLQGFAQNPAYLPNGFRVNALSTAPSSPKLSQVYYDTEDLVYYQWNGIAWKNLGGVCWVGTEAEKDALLLSDPTALDDCLWICTDCPQEGSYTFTNGINESGGIVSWYQPTGLPGINEFPVADNTGLTIGSFLGGYGFTVLVEGVATTSVAGNDININSTNTTDLTATNAININSTSGDISVSSTYTNIAGTDSLRLDGGGKLIFETPAVKAETALPGQFLKLQSDGGVEFQDGYTFTRGIQNILGTVRLGGTITDDVSLVLNDPDSSSNFTIQGAGTSGVIQLSNDVLGVSSSISMRALNSQLAADEDLTLEAGQELRIRTPNVEAGTATVGQALILQNATTGDSEFVDQAATVTVVDNLTSTATDQALSANQGRMLSKTTAGIYFQGENDQFAGSNFHGSIRANDVWNTGTVTELYISVFTQNPLGVQHGGMGEILQDLIPGDILRIRSVENSTAMIGVTVTGTPVFTDSTFDYYTVPVSQYYNTNSSFAASQWYSVDIIKNQSGGGTTNLTYNAGTRTVESDTGTDAVIPLADNTNAGLLPFYQTDTFIPTLVDIGGGATYSIGSSDCRYSRMGNLVFVYLSISSIGTTGTPTGFLEIQGLPYSKHSGDIGNNAVSVSWFRLSDLTSSELNTLGAHIPSGSSTIRFTTLTTTLSGVTFTNPGAIEVTGTYITND